MHRHTHHRPKALTVAHLPVRPGFTFHCHHCGFTAPAERRHWKWLPQHSELTCCGAPLELRKPVSAASRTEVAHVAA